MKRMRMKNHTDVPAYIADFPPTQRKLLKEFRSLVKKLAPKAEEKISYGIPMYLQGGMLVAFGAYDKHIGFYPGAAAIAYFKNDMAAYKLAKGTVQFPVDKPLPIALITRIVKFRVKANEDKARLKTRSR